MSGLLRWLCFVGLNIDEIDGMANLKQPCEGLSGFVLGCPLTHSHSMCALIGTRRRRGNTFLLEQPEDIWFSGCLGRGVTVASHDLVKLIPC